MEVVLAVLAPLELVEDAPREWAEALGAHEAVGVPETPLGVDYLLLGLEAFTAAGTEHVP